MKRFLSFAALISVVTIASCGSNGNDKMNSEAEVVEAQSIETPDSVVISELVSKVNPQVKAEFDSLHAAWYKAMAQTPEVAVSSNMSTATTLPQYDQLVKMGDEILPLVVDKMTDEKYFFTSLVYEGLRPADKENIPNYMYISGQRRAKAYVKMWLKNH